MADLDSAILSNMQDADLLGKIDFRSKLAPTVKVQRATLRSLIVDMRDSLISGSLIKEDLSTEEVDDLIWKRCVLLNRRYTNTMKVSVRHRVGGRGVGASKKQIRSSSPSASNNSTKIPGQPGEKGVGVSSNQIHSSSPFASNLAPGTPPSPKKIDSPSSHPAPAGRSLMSQVTFITSSDRLLELELMDNLKRQQIWHHRARNPNYHLDAGSLSLEELRDRAKEINESRDELRIELRDIVAEMSGGEQSGAGGKEAASD
jgi:hypothetical protein